MKPTRKQGQGSEMSEFTRLWKITLILLTLVSCLNADSINLFNSDRRPLDRFFINFVNGGQKRKAVWFNEEHRYRCSRLIGCCAFKCRPLCPESKTILSEVFVHPPDIDKNGMLVLC